MYENEIEIEYIDVEGMRFLEGIEPFPEIVETLEDIAANNLFMRNRKPWIEIRDPRPADEGSFSEDNARLPSMQLQVLDAWAVYSARRNHQEWIEDHPEAMGYE